MYRLFRIIMGAFVTFILTIGPAIINGLIESLL